ncbi:hypothetical protein ScPMuIL_004463 [Solemya velum]
MIAQGGTNIQYTMLGVNPSPIFFVVDGNTGTVRLIKDLTTDPAQLTFYQVLVKATSSGLRTQTVEAYLNITVTRNENGPIFQLLPYEDLIEDTVTLSESVFKVTATDADGDEIAYSIVGAQPENIFYIQQTGGLIFVTKSLRSTSVHTYTINVRATDQRDPERTADATVTLTILRDNFPPEFLRTPYNAVTTEETDTDTVIYTTVEATDRDLKGLIRYGIQYGNIASALFAIDPVSGDISIKSQPQLRSNSGLNYELAIIAYDSIYPDNQATTTVEISVERNLNAPRWDTGPYRATIFDTHFLGQEVLIVHAVDDDGDAVIYEITGNSQASQYYHIDSITGRITLKQLLTSGTQSGDTINLQVCDSRIPRKCVTTVAVITIIRNRQSPQFLGLPYRSTVPVANPVGQQVISTTATDGDLRGDIFYEIVGDYPSPSFFEVSNSSGMITMRRQVSSDSLLTETYYIVLNAYDTVYPDDRATATVTVSVNRNPGSPVFDPAFYAKIIPESFPLGNSVVDVNATDPDFDPLHYEMESADAEDKEYFYVNPVTGLISLKKVLLQSNIDQFTFNVAARDPAGKTATAVVNIKVTRDQPPVFINTPYNKLITEFAAVDSVVYNVLAQDSDIKGRIVYGIEGLLAAPYYFRMDDRTGTIFVKNTLTNDILDSYKIQVTAYDDGSPGKTATATVTVSVVHNPNTPQFSLPSYSTTIWEYESVTSEVIRLTATDADVGDSIRYEYVGNPTLNVANEYFQLNSDTGSIIIIKSLKLDADRNRLYTMTVRARDQQVPEKTATAQVQINVRRNQDSPRFVSVPYEHSMSENTLLTSSVFTVSALDNDMQGDMVYETIGDDTAPYYFGLNTRTGRINLSNKLTIDKEVTEYTLRVKAYDSVYPEDVATATVAITVIRNEFPPFFLQTPYNVNISEDTAIGVSIIRVNATDNDKDKITFRATGEADTLQYFYLSPDTGIISVINTLQDAPRSTYRMIIQAQDGKNTANADVSISIFRDQANPRFTDTGYSRTVNENIIVGTSIIDVNAQDNDLIGVIKYEVIGNYPAPSFFEIDEVTGRISLSRNLKLDGIRDDKYTLRVIAYDTFRPRNRATASVLINVIRNPGTPQWTLPSYVATISEDHPPLASVILVSAEDTDADDVITYALINEVAQRDLSTGPSEYFMINTDTGEMSLKQSVLYTDIKSFVLTVQACDNGIPQRCIETDVVINIDRSTLPPSFTNTPFRAFIPETMSVDSSILKITAFDASPKGSLVFEVVPPGLPYFTLDGTTGQITLAESVLATSSPDFEFQVAVFDAGEPNYRATADVTIIVIRNPNAPQFFQSSYTETIQQTHGIGTAVLNTTATDLDGDVVVYSLAGDVQTLAYFYVEPSTGIIVLKNSLFPMPSTPMLFRVIAKDQRLMNEQTGTASVTVIIDKDDPPFFVNAPYIETVLESHFVNSTVTQAFARDNDLSGNLVYEIEGIFPAENFFDIVSSTGEITLIRDLRNDFLGLPTYTLRLIAYDSAFPSVRATGTALITVVRNPNAPVFQPNANYFVTISEMVEIGTVIETVLAVDSDALDVVTYQLVDFTGDADSYFFFSPTTGEISVKNNLRKTTPTNFYQLTIRATDGRGNTVNATVSISITREPDDEIPFFVNTPYFASIQFDRPVGSSIQIVSARDQDLAGVIVYEVIGVYPANDFFSVNSTTGIVSVKKNLETDNTKLLSYVLRIKAYDSANPSVTVEENVIITVVRNLNGPQFNKASYGITISETFPLGGGVLQIDATDADGDTIEYHIAKDLSGTRASEFFYLTADEGIFIVRKDLRLTAPTNVFSFTARAVDSGTPNLEDQVNVQITIERDGTDPIFTQQDYYATIIETDPVNSTQAVKVVTATDVDVKETIVYEGVGDGLAMNFFWINRNLGAVYIRRSLMTTLESEFTFQIQAYDTFYPNNRATSRLHITVIRNPNSPLFSQASYEETINEYYPVGLQVLQVSATDQDQDIVRYQLYGSETDQQYFYLAPESGILYLRQSPSLNTIDSSYSMTVEASDQRNPSRTTNVSVTVYITRNRLPFFQNLPENISITEDHVVNNEVYTVRAIDVDLTGEIRYQLIGDLSGPSYFSLNSVTGVISLRQSVFQDRTLQYLLRVSAYDNLIPTMITTDVLRISVQRNPNPPIFTESPYFVRISENLIRGSLVVTVEANDADGDIVRYKMNGGLFSDQFFSLDAETGQVHLIGDLTTINDGSLTFNIQASDLRAPEQFGYSSVIIQIDRDTQPPSFSSATYVVEIDETQAVNSTIITVTATDPDLKSSIVYESIGIYPAQTFFDVKSVNGEVYVLSNLKLDYSARNQYTLQLIAYDQVLPNKRATADVLITVRRNLNYPLFTQSSYQIFVSEAWPVKDAVLNISASDFDGDDVFYNIFSGSGGSSSFFWVDRLTGSIYLRQPLTETSLQSFDFVVRATDNGRPIKYSDATVSVYVQRIEPPRFDPLPPYEINIREDENNGTTIFSISATHSNPVGQIVYEAIGNLKAPYYFTVDRFTGAINLVRPLKGDQTLRYHMVIKTYDTGNPSVFSLADLYINVVRNPNFPSFTTGTYFGNVADDDLPATPIVGVSATDLDEDKLTYELTGDTRCQDVFYIIESTGMVYLKQSLRGTSDVVFNCQVTVSDNGYPLPKTSTAQVTISVSRGEYPIFSPNTYQVFIDEDYLVDRLIETVRATRPNLLGQIVYEVVGNYPAQSFFRVDNTTGEIFISRDIRTDPQRLRFYNLRINAYDSLKPSLISSVDVQINVQRNKNGPQFNPTNVVLRLPQDTGIDFWSYRLNVTDPDSPRIICSILGDAKSQEYFRVDPETCSLSLRKSLADDPDLTDEYRVLIEAKDDGEPIPNSSQATVTILVPRDIYPPLFSNLPNSIVIDESEPENSVIFGVQGIDQDQRGDLHYSIIGVFPAQTFFEIDSNTGQISVRNPPKTDIQQRGSYTVRIELYDTAWPDNRVHADLTINVNRNPNGPIFSPTTYNREIKANFELGGVVIQLTASDPDGDKVTFISQGTAQDLDYFLVNPTSGAIVLRKDLRTLNIQGTSQTFEFSVKATDLRTPEQESFANVIIRVMSLFGPPQMSPYFQEVPINQGIDTVVLKVFARDDDLEGQIQYRLAGFSPGTDYFTLDERTGDISVIRSLFDNPDPNPTYTLLIEAYDTLDPNDIGFTTVTLTVRRNVFPPVFAPTSYTVYANDFDPIGTSLIQITATDSDLTSPENVLVYTLDNSRANGDYFTVGPFDGVISIDTRLSADITRPPAYVLFVIAADISSDPMSSTATVTVSVNWNSQPSFINPNTYNRDVSEGVPVLETILQVFGQDSDSDTTLNGQLEYFIVNSPDAEKIFNMNSQTGEISPRVDLRSVANADWMFTVRVQDKGIPPKFSDTNVVFNIRRLERITFPNSEYTITLEESRPVGDTVIVLVATNPIPQQPLKYEIRGDGLASQYFEVDPVDGSLTIRKSFIDDDNKTPTYTVRVVAFWTSDPTDFATALVKVVIIRNPNAPQFSHGIANFTIQEDAPLRAIVGQVNATDPDSGTNGEIVFEFSRQESVPIYATEYFYINPENGIISVTADLENDRDTDMYQVMVVARDKGVPSKQANTQVFIYIQRNKFPPKFSPSTYEETVDEDFPSGDRVVTVYAQDPDGDSVMYEIVNNPPGSLYFTIDQFSGEITTTTALYQDQASRYLLTVLAKDTSEPQGTGTTTVTVNVRRNPYPPIFDQGSYNVTISEYTDIQSSIIKVRATDADSSSSRSGILRYSIQSSAPVFADPFFIVSSTSGEIFLSRPLTVEESPDVFSMVVGARDLSDVPQYAETTVRVTIIRNLYAPQFINEPYVTSANDSTPVMDIFTSISASDPDKDNEYNRNTPNAQVMYSIVDGDNSRFFGVTDDGQIYVKQPLNPPDRQPVIRLTVEASDMGWKPMTSRTEVAISMSYSTIQEGPLGFLWPMYYLAIKENHALGDLKELDVEYQGNNFINCRFLDAEEAVLGVFTLHRGEFNKNCVLNLKSHLDREIRDFYNLTVLVERSKTKRQTRTIYTWNPTTVIVQVLDVNDNGPKFHFPVYPEHPSTVNKYFGAVSATSKPDRNVIVVEATDPDLGDNGRIKYSMVDRGSDAVPIPFVLTEDDGQLLTSEEFTDVFTKTSGPSYNFEIAAKDQPKNVVDQRTTETTVVINLIYPENRFVIVFNNSDPDDIMRNKEVIRRTIQDTTGYITLIETIEKRRTVVNNGISRTETAGTDVTFVLGQIDAPNFPLLNNSGSDGLKVRSDAIITQLQNKLGGDLQVVVQTVRIPYQGLIDVKTLITKSYIWWMDDPWAALVALAAICILLSIVGIIVIIFTHSRYIKYINTYRISQTSYEQPDFMEPPSFLREYETQSLNMYVPPDEVIHDLGEINMTFEGETVTAQHTGATEGVASAVNPVYKEETAAPQTTGLAEGTTML